MTTSSAGRRLAELLYAAAPTTAFLVASVAGAALVVSVLVAAAVAVTVSVRRAVRGEPLRRILPGPVIVGVCAAVAAVTGETRGFFLAPMLVPFVVLLVCVTSVLAGRPLTGLVLNRLADGPAGWYRVPRLRRVHTGATLVCIVINVVNAVLQVALYRADEPVALGVVHVATGPVFATIVAVTLVLARRAAPAVPGHRPPVPAGGIDPAPAQYPRRNP